MLDDEEEVSPEAWEKAKAMVEGGFAAFDEAVDGLRDAWDDAAAKKFWQQAFQGYASIAAEADVEAADDVAARCFQIAMHFAGGESPDLWRDKAAMYEVARNRKAWQAH